MKEFVKGYMDKKWRNYKISWNRKWIKITKIWKIRCNNWNKRWTKTRNKQKIGWVKSWNK